MKLLFIGVKAMMHLLQRYLNLKVVAHGNTRDEALEK